MSAQPFHECGALCVQLGVATLAGGLLGELVTGLGLETLCGAEAHLLVDFRVRSWTACPR